MKCNVALIDQINSLLPQTQCGQCNYAGCKPYAEAIAEGEADINQCPPGGEAGIHALAALLDRPFKPLNPNNGFEVTRQVARIIESTCIGCTKCIQACPTDAILGASKRMHSVIIDECTGCMLCIPPCPVDCIVMEDLSQMPPAPMSDQQRALSNYWRDRFESRNKRLQRDRDEHDAKLAARRASSNHAAGSAHHDAQQNASVIHENAFPIGDATRGASADVSAPQSASAHVPMPAPPSTPQAILDAIARAKAKKAGKPTP